MGMLNTQWKQPREFSEEDFHLFDVLVRQAADLIEHRQAEEALRESERQLQVLNNSLEQQVQEKTAELRALASDLVKAEQRERNRISHILHDDLQQRLYAIQLQMSFLRDEISQENARASQEVSDIEGQIKEVLDLARHLSIDLNPPILQDEGLAHAIKWLAAQMAQRYGLPVEVQAEGSFVIPDEELHVLLFNCVRELLFNVVKHAQASQAVVALQRVNARLEIEVRDNGHGFPGQPLAQPVGENLGDGDLPQSFGLSTIRHQLTLFDGSMQIKSSPGAGTQVVLTVPGVAHWVSEPSQSSGKGSRESDGNGAADG